MNGSRKRELKDMVTGLEEKAGEALSIVTADSGLSLDGKILLTEKLLQIFIEKGKSDEACSEDEESLVHTIEYLKEEHIDVFYPSTSILKPSIKEIATLHQTVYLNEYIKENPTTKQIEALLCPEDEALYGGAAGGGKVLSDEGDILTPFGFKKGKDLKVGDLVNNPDGSVCKIIQLHPRQDYEKWDISFHDGSRTTVTEGHLWLAWRSGIGKKVKNKKRFGIDAAEIIETKELKKWFEKALEQEQRGISPSWPSIPVCKEQNFNVTYRFPSTLDAYFLGLLLGDGCITKNNISITTMDIEIENHLNSINLDFKKFKKKGQRAYSCQFRKESRKDLTKELKKLKLFGAKSKTKFVPRQFKYGSVDTRYSVIQGLMDTDGTVDSRGQIYFCSISEKLSDDLIFLIRSVGGTATKFEKKEPFYRDKYGNKIICNTAYNVYIKHRDPSKLFRLKRKKERAKIGRPDLMYKRVSNIEIGGRFTGRCITVSHPNGLYVTDDFIVTHNSSYLLMFLLQYVSVKNYQCSVFRKTFMDLDQPGGLIPRSKEWLSSTDAKYNDSKHNWTFPKYNSVLKFGYLDSENDCYRYQGGEYQRIAFDELPHIRPTHYNYLFSRKRRLKGSTVPTQVRSTANPDGPNYAYVKDRFVKPGTKGVPFIASRMEDNKHLDLEDYEKSLKIMAKDDPVAYKKLRFGDWEVQPSGKMFKGEWFLEKKIPASELPLDAPTLRAWDLAASKPTAKNRDPDWTVGTKYVVDFALKRIIIVDQVAFREDPGTTEKLIRATAIKDGYLCEQWFEIEGGATGKSYQAHLEKNILPDFACKGERPSANKEIRAKPLAAACERGDVYLVFGDYIDPMLDEWCTFPDSDHKDRTDSGSLGYKRAAQIYAKNFTGTEEEEEHRPTPHNPELEKQTDFQLYEKQLLKFKKIDDNKVKDFKVAVETLEEISRKYIEKGDADMAEVILDEMDRIEGISKE